MLICGGGALLGSNVWKSKSLTCKHDDSLISIHWILNSYVSIKIVAKSPANRKHFATIVEISARLLYSEVHASPSTGLLTSEITCFLHFRGATGLPASQNRIHILLRCRNRLKIVGIHQIFHHIFGHKCRQGRTKIHIFQTQ